MSGVLNLFGKFITTFFDRELFVVTVRVENYFLQASFTINKKITRHAANDRL